MADRLGLSAQAIAYAGASDHPHDPSDLWRCIGYCTAISLDTDALRKRMAGRSDGWDRLLPEWDNLAALLRHEIATRTDDMAPRTYTEMRRLLEGGEACPACNSTGRGRTCPKCKGSGRRSGGRCRAPGCNRGAYYCSACRGRGYLIPKTETAR